MGLLVALLLLAAACGGGASESGAGGTDAGTGGDGGATPADAGGTDAAGGSSGQAADGDPIRVGYIGALTGGSANMGVPGRQGIELAFEEANDNGGIDGRPLELVPFDDQADPARSVAGAQGFVREGDIPLVIGGPNSPTVLANREVLAEAGIPLLISIAQEDQLVDPDHPTFDTTFRLTEPNRMDVEAISEFIAEEGCEVVDVVADDSAYGQGGANTIRAALEELDISVGEVVSHPPETDSMTAEVLAIQQNDPDCVYLFSLGPSAALFLQTAEEQNLDKPLFGGRGLNQLGFLEIYGQQNSDIIIPTVAHVDKPAYQEFTEKYGEAYGEQEWYMFDALGYDTGRAAVEALTRSGGEGGQALADAIAGITDLEATVGPEGAVIDFGDDHEAGSVDWLTTVTIEGGQLVPRE